MQPVITKDEKLQFKQRLAGYCRQTIQDRIDAARFAIAAAQSAANSEEKSSAGDKYETSRAMNHLEKDMYARQLAEHLKELAQLHAVDTSSVCLAAKPGAFVECSKTGIFIATGLGKQTIEGRDILFLSGRAPLAIALQHKQAGDTILFNGEQLVIHDIY